MKVTPKYYTAEFLDGWGDPLEVFGVVGINMTEKELYKFYDTTYRGNDNSLDKARLSFEEVKASKAPRYEWVIDDGSEYHGMDLKNMRKKVAEMITIPRLGSINKFKKFFKD